MQKLVNICPSCQHEMQISTLRCKNCGLEIRGAFELSPFDRLDHAQLSFLICFLKHEGNLKLVQEEMGVSYPTAKKLLHELLIALQLSDPAEEEAIQMEASELQTWKTDSSSAKASEQIKCKLKQAGGRVIVHTVRGLPCDISVASDGLHFISKKLPITPPYRFDVFDCITELLVANGGTARKGNGRNYKLGEPNCDDSTIVGYIAKHYANKQEGDSVFDPVFVLIAVMEWAGLVHNGRGEVSLTAAYRALLTENQNTLR